MKLNNFENVYELMNDINFKIGDLLMVSVKYGHKSSGGFDVKDYFFNNLEGLKKLEEQIKFLCDKSDTYANINLRIINNKDTLVTLIGSIVRSLSLCLPPTNIVHTYKSKLKYKTSGMKIYVITCKDKELLPYLIDTLKDLGDHSQRVILFNTGKYSTFDIVHTNYINYDEIISKLKEKIGDFDSENIKAKRSAETTVELYKP